MSSIPRGLLRVAVLNAILCLAIRPAIACSICQAGDPLFSGLGATAQEPGALELFAEVRGWKKTSGLLPGEGTGAPDEYEVNQSQKLDLYASWTPIDRVTLTLDLPFLFNTLTEVEGAARDTSSLSGFGDLSLAASFVLWRSRDVLPSTWLEGRAFLKFPTGKSSQTVGGVQDPHLQVGTGSWDFGFGLAAVHRITWGSLYASVFYRENTPGSLEYRYGNVALANAALLVPLGHATGVGWLGGTTAGLELNFRWAGYDEFEDQRYDDSGGSVLYATPSLQVRLPWWESSRAPSLRVAGQIPVAQAGLHGRQHEGTVWSVGLLYGF